MSAHPIISYINISRPIRYYRISRPRLAEPIISDICQIQRSRYYRSGYAEGSDHGPPRYDCVVVEHDPTLEGFQGLHAARVFLFLSFTHAGVEYPCALVQWFTPMHNKPCDKTRMWIVVPDSAEATQVIHLDSVLRDVHLIGVAGNNLLPKDFTYHDSLDAFKAFYVSKFADHHAHEILF